MGLVLAHALEQLIELLGCAVAPSLYSLDVLADLLVAQLAAVYIDGYRQPLLKL